MTDYNDGNWHGWNGGECPVHPDTRGEFVFADGSICTIKPAGAWGWDDTELPIIAFRVTKPYVEPREFWIYPDGAVDCIMYHEVDGAIHVREVLE